MPTPAVKSATLGSSPVNSGTSTSEPNATKIIWRPPKTSFIPNSPIPIFNRTFPNIQSSLRHDVVETCISIILVAILIHFSDEVLNSEWIPLANHSNALYTDVPFFRMVEISSLILQNTSTHPLFLHVPENVCCGMPVLSLVLPSIRNEAKINDTWIILRIPISTDEEKRSSGVFHTPYIR